MKQTQTNRRYLACLSCGWTSRRWGGEDNPADTINAGVAARMEFDDHEKETHPDGASAEWREESP